MTGAKVRDLRPGDQDRAAWRDRIIGELVKERGRSDASTITLALCCLGAAFILEEDDLRALMLAALLLGGGLAASSRTAALMRKERLRDVIE